MTAASTCSRVVGKTGTGLSVRADQQLDLGAAQDHPLRPGCDEPADDLTVLGRDDSLTIPRHSSS